MTRLIIAIFLAGLALAQTPPGGLRAGAAKVDITPRPDQLAVATIRARTRTVMVSIRSGCHGPASV